MDIHHKSGVKDGPCRVSQVRERDVDDDALQDDEHVDEETNWFGVRLR